MKVSSSLALAFCAIAVAVAFRLLYAGQPMAPLASPPFVDPSRGKVYSDGPNQVEILSVDSAEQVAGRAKEKQQGSAAPPPKPLLVAVPLTAGTFPVVQLQHGFSLQAAFYRQLMRHVASHGFIVVAPQMYPLAAGADTNPEMVDAAAVLDWLPAGLPGALPAGSPANPDTSRVALVGHSRGGKVAFGVALGIKQSRVKLAAVAGLDPVDGSEDGTSTPPAVLNHSLHSFGLPFPTLVVGSGLGSARRGVIFPPCAPQKVGHAEFFRDSGPPAYHFVARDYGHMDLLDDECSGLIGKLTYALCKNGPRREPMRRLVGGLVVAFLRSALLGQGADLREALTNASSVPVAIDPPEIWKVEKETKETFLNLGTPLDILA